MARRGKLTAKPILAVHDMTRSADFYRSLGFDVTEWDPTYGWVGEGDVELFHLRLVEGLDVVSNPGSIYLHVGDADKWYSRAAAALGSSLGPPVNKPWDMREFSFTDPSGNLVRLGESLD
jgi:predicted enzyme related to lactoylglutathione lyase